MRFLAALLLFIGFIIGSITVSKLIEQRRRRSRAAEPGDRESSATDSQDEKMFSPQAHVLVEMPDQDLCVGQSDHRDGPASNA